MTAPKLGELSRRERRRVIATLVIRTTLSTVLLLVIFAIVPVEPILGYDTLVRLLVALVIVALVIALQVHAIRSASYPGLRAVEGAINAITVFIIVFALLYLWLDQSDPAGFSEPLTRISAFYFTVTMLSTVGFGDITAKSDVARMMATVQMLLDLAIVAVIVRVFSSVARASRSE